MGQAIGNATEIAEVVEVLRGNGPEDLIHESITLAANMLYLGGKGAYEDCVTLAEGTLKSGRSFEKFVEMVKAQGGDATVLTEPAFAEAAYKKAVLAPKTGYITHMDAEACGRAALAWGPAVIRRRMHLITRRAFGCLKRPVMRSKRVKLLHTCKVVMKAL